MRYLATLAAVFALSCARPQSFDLVIDPRLPPDMQQAVLDGAAEWQSRVPVWFYARVEGCSGQRDGRVCVRPADDAELASIGAAAAAGHTNPGPLGRSAEILIREPANTTFLKELATHELGHAQGLVHSDQDPADYGFTQEEQEMSIMYPYLIGNEGLFTGDVAQWHAVH